MNHTGHFYLSLGNLHTFILRFPVWIPLSEQVFDGTDSTLIFLLFPAQLSYSCVVFIRKLYYNFINSFINFHAFKYIYRCFLSDCFSIILLNTRLITPPIWHTDKKDFIKFHLKTFVTCFSSREDSHMFVNTNHTRTVASCI